MQVKNIVAAAALVVMGAGAVGSAQAATQSTTFTVQMKITSSCLALSKPADLDLGSVTATSSAVTQNGSTTLDVTCSKNTPFTVGLATSTANGGGNLGAGFMKGTTYGDLVPYILYSGSAGGTIWGNTIGVGGNVVSGTGKGMSTPVAFTIYAQATNANFSPDSYSDTVTVNVNY